MCAGRELGQGKEQEKHRVASVAASRLHRLPYTVGGWMHAEVGDSVTAAVQQAIRACGSRL
jgi:hypothetical protein